MHFAFLGSRNDGKHTWREVQALESNFVTGAVLVVDGVLWADKGRILRPVLEQSIQWSTRVLNIENGMLVATRS